jgi:MHS family proline/betaine transporter-like MFS transporter
VERSRSGLGQVVGQPDHTRYGFVATGLAPLFFPSADPVASLLATFTVFGVGFGLRPLGGSFLDISVTATGGA